MASGAVSFQLVDTAATAEDAIRDIRTCSKFSMDCEGVNLGRDGELCLLQIATSKLVYIFDITTLEAKVFQLGLKDVLEDPLVTKLLFDCREDCNSLLHQYGVNVKGIEDLQLLDLLGKKLNGAKADFVNGLSRSIAYHLPGGGFSGVDKEKMHRAFDEDKSLWKRRPLKHEYLTYAATDVFYLARLEAVLIRKLTQAIPEGNIRQLIQYASQRYADFMRHNDKYGKNKYFRHPRLPMNIIPALTAKRGQLTYEPIVDSGHRCICCNQYTGSMRTSQCRRCVLIDRDPKSH